MLRRKTHRTASPKKELSNEPVQLTFMEHIRELQGRLFVIGLAFLVAGAAAYPFFGKIINLIVSPLGKDQELVYLTPGGAFGFIIQVCIYIGIIGALPVIIYQLYRFVMPAVQKVKLRKALGFTVASVALAVTGIVFAYIVSLPAALYFLTSFNLYHINPMLTIDSYFSFVMTYLLAGALLFQLPLVMLIIDSAKPLKPSQLMKYQDKMIIASFIIAAVISPTPDALNQTLLACPLVVMYQIGILIIWWKRRKDRKLQRKAEGVKATPVGVPLSLPVLPPSKPVPVILPKLESSAPLVSDVIEAQPSVTVVSSPKPVVAPTAISPASVRRSVDGFAVRTQSRPIIAAPRAQERDIQKAVQMQVPRRNTPSVLRSARSDTAMRYAVDGFAPRLYSA